MKNYEKYGRELKKYRGGMFCDDYVKPDILKLKKDDECDHDCVRCLIFQMLWLLEEDEESEVDWNKVAVDTPVLVGDFKYGDRYKRYFAEYENGMVYTWDDGYKSYETSIVTGWKYAELAEVDEETGELKVDWDKVEIDTPILVRDFAEDRWEARHFAKYKNGKVYAWSGGVTSWSTEGHVVMWNYAKLAGSEEE